MATRLQDTDRGQLLTSTVNAHSLGRGDLVAVELVQGVTRPMFLGLRAVEVLNNTPQRHRPDKRILTVREQDGAEHILTPKTNEVCWRVVGGRAGGVL